MPLARHDCSYGVLKRTLLFLLTCLLRGMTTLTLHKNGRTRFLLTCLLRGMTGMGKTVATALSVSTHMPLARHDRNWYVEKPYANVSTHMPLARHDPFFMPACFPATDVSTHMPLARHDITFILIYPLSSQFLLTCLLRGMTYLTALYVLDLRFLLTCLLRGMTLKRSAA